MKTGLYVFWLRADGEVIQCTPYDNFRPWGNLNFEKHHYFVAEILLEPLIDH